MNKVVLKGRWTKDMDVRYSQGENAMAIARNSMAINRKGKDNGADFINCVAFGKTAEFLEKYGAKGQEMLITGRIQTGSYEKDGHKVYTTDVVVEECEFCGSKSESNAAPASSGDGFMNIPEGIDEELPFS